MKSKNVLHQTGDVQVRQIKSGEQLNLTTVIPIRIARHKFTKVIIQPGDVLIALRFRTAGDDE